MPDLFENVDWAAYGRSKADELVTSYRTARVHFAQCSVTLSFDDYLNHEGILLEDTADQKESHEEGH